MLGLVCLRLLRPVCYVEKDPLCREVIAHRMSDGLTAVGPVYQNIETYRPSTVQEQSAVAITAGFPCQGVCRAGKQKGVGDPRTGLIKNVFALLDMAPSV